MRLLVFLASALLACGGAASRTTTSTSGTAPIARDAAGKGVSLTGEKSYDERHDPSGWSGSTKSPEPSSGSSPSGTGGGPSVEPAKPEIAVPKPSAPPPPKSTPAKPTTKLPESKELDTTPPPKDLQF